MCDEFCIQEGLLLLTTQRAARNVKRAFFLLGVGAFRPTFYGNGTIP